ncbi:MAG: Ig-like domain-containing protein [Burkholderiaceae bacterium]
MFFSARIAALSVCARPLAVSLSLALLSPVAALADSPAAAGVRVKFDLTDPAASPFPSDRYTVREWSNQTFRRVHLPTPDCTVRVSDCQDIAVINSLDGFSTQPRITVPFTGAIDPASVSSETVYLLNLGDVQTARGFGERVGINQRLWDPATNTLVFEPDELLQEHTRYVLIVTDGVRDAAGKPIQRSKMDDDDDGDTRPGMRGRGNEEYQRDLRDAMRAHRSLHRVAAASVFTTQTATGDLAKIMRQIKATTPAPASFLLGTAGGAAVRSVFTLANVQGIQFSRQVGTSPTFQVGPLPTPALGIVPGAVGQIAYGKFSSPSYQTAGQYIPAIPTGRSGSPPVQGSNDLVFQLFVPAGPKPAGGWPVAIFGHGFTDSMYGAPWTVGAVFASQGIATLAINVVGHGGGALGTLSVLRTGDVPVTVPAGGRGFDQDGNGVIDSTEGVNAAPPRTIIGSRDGLRQTVIDLMQLVRQVEVGMDIDGDGTADLNAQRIYYAGQSFGGIYGTKLLGIEPNIKAGVPNVPGGSITEVARLGVFRFLTAVALATRTPQLLNVAPTPGVPVPFNLNFNENMPLRNLPLVVNNVPGATAIAQVLDRFEWVQQSGNPVSYAPLIRKAPLAGSAAKPVIVQFAKGDVTVPNPSSSAILRAGALQDRATYFRNDLAYALNPTPTGVPKNPHTFLTNIGIPASVPYAIAAQSQIAAFFASNGLLTIDPDGPSPIFEVPIVLPLPEGLNFIP